MDDIKELDPVSGRIRDMSYKIRTFSILLGAALALTGCGSGDSAESSFTTIVASSNDESPAAADGDERSVDLNEGQRAASIEVDGVTYFVSCTAISPSNLSNPIGLASYLGDDIAVRSLAGVNSDNAIAVEVDGGACKAGDQQLSDWSLAIAQDVENDLANQIACDSGLKVSNC